MSAPMVSRTVLGEVRLHLDVVVPQVLAMVADAYAEDPAQVGALLERLAQARVSLADVQDGAERRNTPDQVLAGAGAAVDAALEALDEAVVTEYVTVDLSRRDASRLAGEIAVVVVPKLGAAA